MFAIAAMDLKEAMAVNVRRVRHAKGITQEELAHRAALSARYLGSIERAAVSASVTVLGQLAEALRVDPCDLIRMPSHRRTRVRYRRNSR
jgi:transcriptional regulator with XRE-family HTH domain